MSAPGDLSLLALWPERSCVNVPVAVFYPERGADTRTAKAICAECPIRLACLNEALAVPAYEDIGVWGGTSALQRRQIRRRLGGRTRKAREAAA